MSSGQIFTGCGTTPSSRRITQLEWLNLNPAVEMRDPVRLLTSDNPGWHSTWVQTQRWLKFSPFQEVSQSLTEDAIPFFQPVQLLSSFPQPGQKASDPNICATRLTRAPWVLLMVSLT